MLVRQLLESKPKNFVETISELQSLSDVVRRLAELKIGAVVVTNGDGGVVGIISERDIVRQLAAQGPSCLSSAMIAWSISSRSIWVVRRLAVRSFISRRA